MNKDNVQIAITVMERVIINNRPFCMESWQYFTFEEEEVCKTEKELNECGTAACFAGRLAVSPEFQAAGGRVGYEGEPIFKGQIGARAISEFLECPLDLARNLCAVYICNIECGEVNFGERFYGVRKIKDITPQMVVDKLKEMLNELEVEQ